MPRIGALLALGTAATLGCSIDDRNLRVRGDCVTPPQSGLLSDFSAARPGPCPAGICPPDLVWMQTSIVTLGVPEMEGLIFPYRSAGLNAIALNLTSTVTTTYSGQALRAKMASGSPPPDASIAYDGFALQFLECVDTSAYSAVSFRIAGSLGSCPLRFATQFKTADAGPSSGNCPIAECAGTDQTPVAPGATTLKLPASTGAAALRGMRWEFNVVGAPQGGCDGDFTIDDIRLVAAP